MLFAVLTATFIFDLLPHLKRAATSRYPASGVRPQTVMSSRIKAVDFLID
ncbi:hypothetical protein [Brucella neotomae]|nr:hypothetical protein [Brucella neotomae]